MLKIDSGDTVIFNSLMLFEGKLKAGMTFDDVLALRKSVLDRKLGAYAVCSSAVDYRVTQMVDGNKGVHAMISKEIFK